MMTLTEPKFVCPKCGKQALSVEDYDSIKEEEKLDEEQVEWLKRYFPIGKMKDKRFWRCPSCDKQLYYQTDLKGNLIVELRFPKVRLRLRK
jgi:rubredoxin